ncbi:MAG: hypothetical protein ACYC7B_01285 [Burkholderiales bacterium]
MKQSARLWFYRAMILASVLSPLASRAQQESEGSLLQQARAAVARALNRPATDVSFEGLTLVRDKLGDMVCGTANGKRFLADAARSPTPPQIEGALSPSMFDFLWNARCRGMSASEADAILKRDMNR